MLILADAPWTPEWFQARRCKVTASHVGDFMAGRETKRYREYLMHSILDIEQVADHKEDHPDPWEMKSRTQKELGALWFTKDTGIDLRPAGLLTTEKVNWFAATTQGLAGDWPVIVHHHEILGRMQASDIKPQAEHLKHIQAVLAASDAPGAYLVYYLIDKSGEEKGICYDLGREEGTIREILEAAFLFRIDTFRVALARSMKGRQNAAAN